MGTGSFQGCKVVTADGAICNGAPLYGFEHNRLGQAVSECSSEHAPISRGEAVTAVTGVFSLGGTLREFLHSVKEVDFHLESPEFEEVRWHVL